MLNFKTQHLSCPRRYPSRIDWTTGSVGMARTKWHFDWCMPQNCSEFRANWQSPHMCAQVYSHLAPLCYPNVKLISVKDLPNFVPLKYSTKPASWQYKRLFMFIISNRVGYGNRENPGFSCHRALRTTSKWRGQVIRKCQVQSPLGFHFGHSSSQRSRKYWAQLFAFIQYEGAGKKNTQPTKGSPILLNSHRIQGAEAREGWVERKRESEKGIIWRQWGTTCCCSCCCLIHRPGKIKP